MEIFFPFASGACGKANSASMSAFMGSLCVQRLWERAVVEDQEQATAGFKFQLFHSQVFNFGKVLTSLHSVSSSVKWGGYCYLPHGVIMKTNFESTSKLYTDWHKR